MQLSLQELEKPGRLLPPLKGESQAQKLSRGVTITYSKPPNLSPKRCAC